MTVYGLFLYDTFTPLCFLDHLGIQRMVPEVILNICVLLYVLFQEIYIIIMTIFHGVV